MRMFDLPGYVVARLARAGVAQVEDLGLCTYADPAQFYSYRRSTHRAEPDYGRHVNAIALAGLVKPPCRVFAVREAWTSAGIAATNRQGRHGRTLTTHKRPRGC